MSPAKDKLTEAERSFLDKIVVHDEPPPKLGETVFEREIPSDPALVTLLVVRALEFLKSESFIHQHDETKIALCLEEALQNAVKHGSLQDFKKKVHFRIFLSDREWGVAISDQGSGFDPKKIPDPVQGEGLWGESGRGLFIISHYMDRAVYYNGGSTVVMANNL